MNIKKILAAALCAALLLCFVGCDNAPASTPSTPAESSSDPMGALFISVGTEFRVIYDSEGTVIAVDPLNSTASDIILNTAPIGTACDAAISELIRLSIDAGKHPSTKIVVVKQALGCDVPSASFLEDIRIDAAAAATGYEVVLIKTDELTEDGNITADTAKAILSKQFTLTDVAISCSAEPVDGVYVLTYERDGAELEYEVNALTGSVVLPSLPSDMEYLGDDMYIDDTETEPVVVFDDLMEDEFAGPDDGSFGS